MNDIRFGSPVSASWCARWWMRACAAWRSRMSRTIVMRMRLAVAHHRADDELDRNALPLLVEDHALVGRSPGADAMTADTLRERGRAR